MNNLFTTIEKFETESIRLAKESIEDDLKNSAFLQYISQENFNIAKATELYKNEILALEQELAIATEFSIVKSIKLLFIKTINYFKIIYIDITVPKKIDQLIKYMQLHINEYMTRVSNRTYDSYRDMLISVPNNYSGTNYAKTIDHFRIYLMDICNNSSNYMESLHTALAFQIASLNEDKTNNVLFNYKKEIKTITEKISSFSKELIVNFSSSTSKNFAPLSQYISSFSDMSNIVENCIQLGNYMKSIDLEGINSRINNLMITTNNILTLIDNVDDKVYLENVNNIKNLSDYMFQIAKLLDLLSTSYYQGLTIIGNAQNALEFLNKKL